MLIDTSVSGRLFMNNIKEIFQDKTFRWVDHTKINTFQQIPFTSMTSFGIDDALALSISNKLSPATMRLWVHPNTVVLGIPDGRLPYVEEGVQFLTQAGYHVVIRNSGGLAVVLDEEVLNISLIIPNAKKISIHDCYDMMYRFVQYSLRDLTDQIKAYEITGSYCPGDYDLSIRGIKFAGISQRRVQDGAAVQIYLDVNGNSEKRAKLIRHFYDISLKNQETKFNYPTVEHEKMGSLAQLLGQPLTMDDMRERVQLSLIELSDNVITMPFSSYELERFQARFQQMVKRNEKLAALQ